MIYTRLSLLSILFWSISVIAVNKPQKNYATLLSYLNSPPTTLTNQIFKHQVSGQEIIEDEFDPVDVAALKAIRDNAPIDSPLKIKWADETQVRTWYGVGWNSQSPKKVTFLSIESMALTSLDVHSLGALERLTCFYNNLTSLNINGLSKLKSLSCWGNQLSFSNLPAKSLIAGEYIYQPQNSLASTNSISFGETIDYSSEALIDGVATVFKWYKNNVQIDNIGQTGKYSPTSEGYYYCEMTNAKFPGLIMTTSPVKVGNPPEYDPQDIIIRCAIKQPRHILIYSGVCYLKS